MKNILLRSVSGVIYVALIVAGVLVNKWTMLGLCVILVTLAQIEFFMLIHHSELKRNPFIAVIDTLGGIILTGSSWLFCNYSTPVGFPAFLLYFLLRLIYQLYAGKSQPLQSLSYSFMGQLYISLPIALLPLLPPHLALAMFIFIWLNDTGAFAVGCSIGRHRLFPSVSPKKSWEGFWGGMVFTIATAIILSTFWPAYFMDVTTGKLIGLAVTVSVIATWGDLVESMIKRSFNVKDSGKLIPGHGGILDRIDSLLCVLPATLCYFYFVL